MDSHCKARREILHSMEALIDIPTLTVLGGESHQTYTDRTGRQDMVKGENTLHSVTQPHLASYRMQCYRQSCPS